MQSTDVSFAALQETFLRHQYTPQLTIREGKMGRKKLYRPSFITISDRLVIEKIREEILADRKQQIAVFDDFKRFTELNGFEIRSGEALLCFAAVLSRYYDPGTVSTRLGYIRAELLRNGRITSHLIEKHFKLKKALKGNNHAPDVNLFGCLAKLHRAPRGIERTSLAVILLTGLRNEDLKGAGDIRIAINGNITADVLVAKNRRSIGERTTLHLRGDFSIFNFFDDNLRDDVKVWCESAWPRTTIETAILLHWMYKEMKKTTTYTFRRQYIHRILDLLEDPSTGYIPYDKVISYTLHFEEKTVKAFYMKRAQDTVE